MRWISVSACVSGDRLERLDHGADLLRLAELADEDRILGHDDRHVVEPFDRDMRPFAHHQRVGGIAERGRSEHGVVVGVLVRDLPHRVPAAQIAPGEADRDQGDALAVFSKMA